MESVDDQQPVACTLQGGEQVARRERWLRLVELALLAKTTTERGAELRFRGGGAILAELTELAALESECCAFARWNVSELDDEIRLEVETEPDKAPAVWALLDD